MPWKDAVDVGHMGRIKKKTWKEWNMTPKCNATSFPL
eukprot:gene12428-9530_t